MKPLRVLVADDEHAARAAIVTLLADDDDVAVAGEAADGQTTLEAIRRDAPDIVFLDIQMPELDGFAVLRALDPAAMPVVVFVTAYDRFALQAFEAHALDYLLKPFDDERFYKALARAKQQARQNSLGALGDRLMDLLGATAPASPRFLQRLVIRNGGRATVVDTAEIDWIEADGDYLTVHAGRARHVMRETMKDIEQSLDPARFVRVHRSTIVNIGRIRGLEPYYRGEYVVILQDGTKVKLSRGYQQHLESALGRPI